MKKLLALLLALVMVLALAACGDDAKKTDDDDDDDKPSTSTTAPAGDPTDPTDPPIVNPDSSNPTQDPTQTYPVRDPNEPTEVPDEPTEVPDEPTDDPAEDTSLRDQIIGDWTTTVEMTGSMIQLPTFEGKLLLKIDYTLREDGTGVATMDKAAFDASVDANYQALVDAMVELLYQQLGGKEVAEAAVQAQFNMSCAEYAKVLPDTLKSTVSYPSAEEKWSLSGNILSMGTNKVTVSIDGDTMTWTGVTGLEMYDITSMVFERI